MDVDIRAPDNSTPLHFAGREGHLEVCGLLISNKANARATTKDGNTALHLSALGGHADVCRLLLETELYVSDNRKVGNATTTMGDRPLFNADVNA